MREHVIKNVKEGAPKRMANNLQLESRTINSKLRTGEQSLDKVKAFFHDVILANYKNTTARRVNNKFEDFMCLVSNLYYTKSTKPLSIPLGTNAYNANSFPSRFTIDIVKILHKYDYIELKKGFKAEKKEDSRVTRIWKTDKLHKELFCKNNEIVTNNHIIEDCDLIILRDNSKEKINIKFRNTKYTNQLSKEIAIINEVNRQFIVEYPYKKQFISLTTDLHTVFNNGTFEDGGRFYTGHHGYQSCTREDRKLITINGCETVELDYNGLHPHLLYAKVGIQAQGDQYTLVHPNKALRPVLKKGLLMLLNADSELNMIRGINNKTNHENRELKELMIAHAILPRDLIDMFKSTHKPISHYFCSGQGVKLMNIDSEIAKNILLHFVNINEPCLCIHDSFIVRKENEDMLKKVMTETYTKIVMKRFDTKTEYTCNVK